MKSILNVLLIVTCWQFSQAEDKDVAIRECGNLHRLEFQNIPNAEASYANQNCMLKCSVGGTVLSSNAINEAFPCPMDSNGICHKGECVQTHNEAVRQCGNLLHIDFLNTDNHGTTYLNDGCSIKCVLGGNLVLNSTINEGFHCPTEPNGMCHSGQCVKSNVPTVPPTTLPPTTTVRPSIFTTHKIDQIQVTIYSAKLKQSYANLSSTICLEKSRPPGFGHFADCKKTCQTGQVTKLTDHPEWNLTPENPCLVTGPFIKEDQLILDVNQSNSVKNSLGNVNLNVELMVNHFYYLADAKTDPNVRHESNGLLVIKKIYAVYRGGSPIGEMDLMFEVKLSLI